MLEEDIPVIYWVALTYGSASQKYDIGSKIETFI
jgi:hypothetical protein